MGAQGTAGTPGELAPPDLEERLRASEAMLVEAQRIARLGSYAWEVSTDSVEWSPELYTIYGLDPRDGPATFADYLARVHPTDRDRVAAAVERTLATLEPYEHDYRIVLPEGEVRWVHARGELATTDDGRPLRLTGYCQDITDRRAADDRRRRAQADLASHQRILARIARRESVDTILGKLCQEIEVRYPDARCSILLADPAKGDLHHIAGASLPQAFRDAINGLPIAVGMGACGTAAARKEIVVVADTLDEPLTSGFVELAVAFGLRSVWSQPLLSASGDLLGTFAIYRPAQHRPSTSEIRTVSVAGSLAALAIERDLAEKALTAAVQVDPLTGLPNRSRFLEQLAEGLAKTDSRLGVMFLDLDRFKWINDSLGHPAGDRILVEVASRLERACGPEHAVARFGGDEFTVLIPDATAATVAAVAERVEDALVEPFFLDGGEFFLSVSIGVALNDATSDPYGLVRDADAAMYAAKENGRARWTMFDERLRERALERVTVESQLRRAIERDEFVMHYQPILDLARHRWTGLEALVRWQHPTRGLIAPDRFIPLAEDTGLIVPLGLLIFDKVIAQAAAWVDSDALRLRVAANVSAAQLPDPTLAAALSDTLRTRGLPADLLILEVTETAVMEQLDAAREALAEVTGAGVRIMIDDFGTGYSSIARLEELPVTGIKIDRRFTATLGTVPRVEKVVAAIIDLAHALDLSVVAEGVETDAALNELCRLGCDYGQGYRLARPVDAGHLSAVLATVPA